MKTKLAFERVRRANLVPNAQHSGDRDLFARITADPGDMRLAHRSGSRGRRRVVGAIAVAVTAVAASTAFAVSHWNVAPAVEQPVTKNEYLQAQKSLTLPPGASWPEFKIEPNTITSKGGGASRAVMVTQHAWECYWVRAIREQDRGGQQSAHAQLEKLLANNVIVAPNGAPEDWAPSPAPKGPYAIWANDGGLQYFEKAYADAASGQPQRLIQSCRANG
jgi:hypothetical protein